MIDYNVIKENGGMIGLALDYKISKLKKELNDIPKSSRFQRDTIETEIKKLEGYLERRKQNYVENI